MSSGEEFTDWEDGDHRNGSIYQGPSQAAAGTAGSMGLERGLLHRGLCRWWIGMQDKLFGRLHDLFL